MLHFNRVLVLLYEGNKVVTLIPIIICLGDTTGRRYHRHANFNRGSNPTMDWKTENFGHRLNPLVPNPALDWKTVNISHGLNLTLDFNALRKLDNGKKDSFSKGPFYAQN